MTPEAMHDVRHDLARIRTEAGISQEQIAKTIGLKHQAHVSRIERAQATTSITKVAAWADACGYDVAIASREAPSSSVLLAELEMASDEERAAALRLLRLFPRLRDDRERQIVQAYLRTLEADADERSRGDIAPQRAAGGR